MQNSIGAHVRLGLAPGVCLGSILAAMFSTMQSGESIAKNFGQLGITYRADQKSFLRNV